MATRVYDLAKKLGISSKEALEIFKENGITLTTIAVVTPEALAVFEKAFAQRSSKAPAEQKAAPVKKSSDKETAPVKPVEKVAPKPEPQKAPVAAPVEKPAPVKSTAPEPIKPEATKPEPVKQAQAPVKPQEQPKPAQTAQPQQPQRPVAQTAAEAPPVTIVNQPMTVADFAEKAHKQVNEVILTLLKQGTVAPKNQLLPEKVISHLIQHYGLVEGGKPVAKISQESPVEVALEGEWQERLPVVVVIGHVDHGKTTLLDFIRKTRVAAKEKGGITQHLGAYEVKTPQGNLVFLDTPGHEAFSLMRARGIKVADIAILVVAADDGVMPQTVEAIKRSQAAGIPLVVALNKIDKATPAQIEVVKRQLAQHDLAPEEWGGQTSCMPISAKLGQGIDELLEVVILQSQLMDLKANISAPAQGYVLESRLEKGRGPVATVICLHGILKIGDYFTAGSTSGRVSSLVDSYGKRIQSIKPSLPALVAGFSELPQSGDPFEVGTQQAIKRAAAASQVKPELMHKKGSGEAGINLIVKADNASSREAVVNALSLLKSDHRKASIVYSGIGDISERDIILAADTGSLIYGFQVRVQPNAQELVQKKNILIKSFDIIYKLLEDVELLLQAGKPIKMVNKKVGEASILKVFDIKNLGIVAGAVVKNGRIVRDGKVMVWRGKHKVGEGSIKGLQRDRKAVKEVHAGFECAFLVDGFDTWEVDDRVECYQEVPA